MNYEDDDDNQRKMKRGVLPKRATQIMKTWLFQHIAVSSVLGVISFGIYISIL